MNLTAIEIFFKIKEEESLVITQLNFPAGSCGYG